MTGHNIDDTRVELRAVQATLRDLQTRSDNEIALLRKELNETRDELTAVYHLFQEIGYQLGTPIKPFLEGVSARLDRLAAHDANIAEAARLRRGESRGL